MCTARLFSQGNRPLCTRSLLDKVIPINHSWHQKLETLDYGMLTTASLCVPSFWHSNRHAHLIHHWNTVSFKVAPWPHEGLCPWDSTVYILACTFIVMILQRNCHSWMKIKCCTKIIKQSTYIYSTLCLLLRCSRRTSGLPQFYLSVYILLNVTNGYRLKRTWWNPLAFRRK